MGLGPIFVYYVDNGPIGLGTTKVIIIAIINIKYWTL